MRTLKTIGTGSSGNCWILDCDGEKLILDAGVKLPMIKAGLDWNIDGLVGVVVSHAHKDHSESEKALSKMGLQVFAPYHDAVFSSAILGNYIINSFPLPHNGVPNCGFMIRHGTWKMVYLTDFEFCRFSLKSFHLNTMLVECNYSDVLDGSSPNFEHVVKGHAGLKMVKNLIAHNASEDLQNVILCHLSDRNADPTLIQKTIEKVVPPGCAVEIAEKGKIYAL